MTAHYSKNVSICMSQKFFSLILIIIML